MTNRQDRMTLIGGGDIVAEVGGPVDETRVTLGIHGAELDPAEISKLLGCPPTSAHRRGDPRASGLPPWPQGCWLLCVEGEAPTRPEELVDQLLRGLPMDTAIWEHLRTKYTVRVTFGIHIGDWNRGFELSPASVERLASLGAPVGFDIYVDADEKSGD